MNRSCPILPLFGEGASVDLRPCPWWTVGARESAPETKPTANKVHEAIAARLFFILNSPSPLSDVAVTYIDSIVVFRQLSAIFWRMHHPITNTLLLVSSRTWDYASAPSLSSSSAPVFWRPSRPFFGCFKTPIRWLPAASLAS